MFFQKLLKFILGYIVISARGAGVEKLINLAVSRGILLWDLQNLKDRAIFKTYPDNFFLLRPLSRKTRCSLQIEKKRGLPFLLARLKKRRGLLLGFFCFVIILYILSNFIWFIEIKGHENVPEEAILAAARELGLVPGTLKRNFDFPALEMEFLLVCHELSWVGLQMQGTKLTIEVEEEIISLQDVWGISSDLVASRDGLIEDVLTLVGEAKVVPGEIVIKDQVLISGVLTGEHAGRVDDLTEEGVVRQDVRARGEVWARVWYEFFSTVSLTEIMREKTGDLATGFSLRFDDRKFSFGQKRSPYRNYARKTIKYRLKWRNLAVPVEFIRVNYYELIITTQELTREEALYKAKEDVFSLAEKYIPACVERLSYEVSEISPFREGRIRVRLMIETRENIAKEKPNPPNPPLLNGEG